MNLYKNFNIFLLSLFFITTNQHVCTDTVSSPIIVKRTLGQGSQGKAEEVTMNRQKFVLKTFLNTGQVRENLNEALMHKILSHADVDKKNVVTYYLCFKKDNSYQLLMEYFSSNWENSYFKSTIKNKTEKERAQIYKSLIEKVQFMHKQGILHCDLKPDNIFSDIQDIGNFKLGDFGLSKYYKNQDVAYKCSAGSAGYVAPEISKSSIQPQDAGKYDMFAIGVMIAEIEANNSCNVLDQSKQLQESYFQQQAYDTFIQNVYNSLPQTNSKQKQINGLIWGLLQKDESKRFDEEKSIQILNEIIYNTQPLQQQPQNNQNLHNQFAQNSQKNQQQFQNRNQPIKPIHNMNIFQKNAQENIIPKQQYRIDQDRNVNQQRKNIYQDNFFNQQKYQKENNQYNRRNKSYDVYNQQNIKLESPQQQINIQKKRVSNQHLQRQQILARRNQSNDIWGVLQNNNKFLI